MSRTSEILARLALTKEQIARERERGAREGDLTSRAAAAIPQSIAALADVGTKAYEGAVAGRAKELAARDIAPDRPMLFVADEGGLLGPPSITNLYTESPEAAAQKKLESEKPQNWLDEAFGVTKNARSQAYQALTDRERARREKEREGVERELGRATTLYIGDRDIKARGEERKADREARGEEHKADREAQKERAEAEQRFRQEQAEAERRFRQEQAEAERKSREAIAALNRRPASDPTPGDKARDEMAVVKLNEEKAKIEADKQAFRSSLDTQATVLDLLDSGVETGKSAKFKQGVMGAFGKGDPNVTALQTTMTELRNLYGRAITASVLGEAEYARALAALDVSSQPQEIKDAITLLDSRVRKEAAAKYPGMLDNYTPKPIKFGQQAGAPSSAGPSDDDRDAYEAAWLRVQKNNGRSPTPDEIHAAGEEWAAQNRGEK